MNWQVLLDTPSAKVHCTAGVSELGIKHESHFPINYLVAWTLNSSLYDKYAVCVKKPPDYQEGQLSKVFSLFHKFFDWWPWQAAPMSARVLRDCELTTHNYLWEVTANERSSWRMKENKCPPVFQKDKREDLGNYRLVNLFCLGRW